jgi:hypothetical protein
VDDFFAIFLEILKKSSSESATRLLLMTYENKRFLGGAGDCHGPADLAMTVLISVQAA